jgi:hypothetical protein
MNILKKIKSFFSKNKKEKPKTACELLLEIVEKRKKDTSNRPENLTDSEWVGVLNRISFGVECTGKNNSLKSPTRKRQRDEKIKKAFDLLSVYIREL